MPTRKSYQESLQVLEKDYSSFVSESEGVQFFRTFVGDGDDLGNLSLPKTFFGRCEINDCSFANSDLSESGLCWNDFVSVDFSDADLTNADLRASQYSLVKFIRTDLKGADLRHSNFDQCDFSDAGLDFAKVTQDQLATMNLSSDQLDAVIIENDPGPEPGG